MDKAKLVELAERCEAAEGQDAFLDLDIHKALDPEMAECFTLTDAPDYCASLDAAVTLVPEGYNWQVGVGNHAWATVSKGFPPSMRVDPIAATPALALCSAALRARAEMVE